METKLSDQLRQLLQSTDASQLVDVVVELYHDPTLEAVAPQNRSQRIAHLKESLSRKAVPLQETLKSIGGEVTGEVWLNQTLRVRLPADKVSLLSDQDEVAKLDVEHQLERD